MSIDASEFTEEFNRDWSSNRDQRDRANEELRFLLVAGGQWEGWLEDTYENRARMEVDQTSDYMWRTYAEYADNRRMVNYSPEDGSTDPETAEILDGLIRRDLRRKGGQSAIDTAVLETFCCGHGALILNDEFANPESPDEKQQNIIFTEVPNAYSRVIFDPGAARLDKADAKRVTLITPFTREAYEEEFGEDAPSPTNFNQFDRGFFNFNTTDFVYTATRWHIVNKKTESNLWHNPVSDERVTIDGKPDEDTIRELKAFGFQHLFTKPTIQRQVMKTVYAGSHILMKERRITGKFLPVIPFYGYRAFIDGSEHYYGLARKRMDAQRMLNMSVSLAAEGAAHSSEGKPIFTPEQVQGLETSWSQNNHQKPYMLAEAVRDRDGTIKHLGPLAMLPGTTIAPASQQLIAMTSEFITIGTGGAPQDIANPDASGKAINALIKRVDKNTRPIFDNIDVSYKHLGVVYQSKAAEIYGDPVNIGRTVQLVNDRGDTTPIVLLSTRADSTGGFNLANDVSKGTYEVIVGVTRQYSSEQEEAFEGLKDLFKSITPDNPIHNDVLQELIALLPTAGLEDLQERVRMIQLTNGAQPKSEKEEKIVQQIQQDRANQPEDPNAVFLRAAAEKEQSQVVRNTAAAEKDKAAVETAKFEAAETVADTEKTRAETQQIIQELLTSGGTVTPQATGAIPG